MGAVHLAQACAGITLYFESNEFRTTPGRLDFLVDVVMTEAVRVQRKVRQLVSA